MDYEKRISRTERLQRQQIQMKKKKKMMFMKKDGNVKDDKGESVEND